MSETTGEWNELTNSRTPTTAVRPMLMRTAMTMHTAITIRMGTITLRMHIRTR